MKKNILQKQLIKYIIELKSSLNPQYLKQHKIKLEDQAKQILFNMLQQNQQKQNLQTYINSAALIIPKTIPFLKQKFNQFFDKITTKKKQLINQELKKLNINFKSEMSQLINAIFSNSSQKIILQFKKQLINQQYASLLMKNLEIDYGLSKQPKQISNKKSFEEDSLNKYLKQLSQEYFIEEQNLQKVKQGIMVKYSYQKIQPIIIDEAGDNQEIKFKLKKFIEFFKNYKQQLIEKSTSNEKYSSNLDSKNYKKQSYDKQKIQKQITVQLPQQSKNKNSKTWNQNPFGSQLQRRKKDPKNLYILFKLKLNISIKKNQNIKLSLISNSDKKIIPIVINRIQKYNLIYCENLQQNNYKLQYSSESQQFSKDLGIKIKYEDLSNKINFLFEQIKLENYQTQIQKIGQYQRFFAFSLLGNSKIFNQIINWLKLRQNKIFLQKILMELKNTRQYQDFKLLNQSIQKNLYKYKMFYILSYLYEISKLVQIDRNYEVLPTIQRIFIRKEYYKFYNQIKNIIQMNKQFDNQEWNTTQNNIILKKCTIQTYYFDKHKKKQFINELSKDLNYLIQNYNHNNQDIFELLIKIIENQVNQIINNNNKKSSWSSLGSWGSNSQNNQNIQISYGNKNALKIIIDKRDTSTSNYIYYSLIRLVFNDGKINDLIQIISSVNQKKKFDLMPRQLINKCNQIIKFSYNKYFTGLDQNFIQFYKKIAKLNKKYLQIFFPTEFQQKIKSMITQYLKRNKNQFIIEILKTIYIDYDPIFKDSCAIFLAQFFKNSFMSSYREKYELNVMEKLIQLIFKFYVNENKIREKEQYPIIEDLSKYLTSSSYDFEKAIKSINKSIAKINLQIQSQKNIVDYTLNTIFKAYEKKQHFHFNFYHDLMQKNKWIFIFDMHRCIIEFCLQMIMNKLKSDHHFKEKYYDSINESITNNRSVNQQWVDYVFQAMCNQSEIKVHDLKQILYEKPLRAQIYIKKLKKKQGIIKHVVQQLKASIQNEQLNYQKLKKVLDYDELTWKNLQKLFDVTNGNKLKFILLQLNKKCQNYLNQLNMIINICSEFQKYQFIKQILAQAKTKKNQFLNCTEAKLNIHPNDQFKIFQKIMPQVHKFYNLNYLKKVVSLKQYQNSIKFCQILNQSMQYIIKRINSLDVKYKNRELFLNELFQITKNCSINDIKRLIKLDPEANQQDITNLQKAIQKIKLLNQYQKINSGIIYLFNLYKQDILPKFQEFSQTYKLYQQQKYDQINVYVLYQLTQYLQNKYNLKMQKDNQVVKIIKLIWTSPSISLWEFSQDISPQLIQDLKDYLNDQEQSFINAKNIAQLEYCNKFYFSVLKQSTHIEQFFKNLKYFLQKNLKKEVSSLSSSIQSCLVHLLSLQKIYYQSRDRESSFKYVLVDLMQNCKIILKHHKQKDEKQFLFKVKNNKEHKQQIYDTKQLQNWRDKSLLLINSSKKQQLDMILPNKMVKQYDISYLKQFIEMYNKIEKILENYKRFSQMGYFNNFIEQDDQQRDQIAFHIQNKNFQQIDDYNEKLCRQCERWKLKLEQGYFRSFTLCHFQGKELKKMVKRFFKFEYSDIFYHILNNVNSTKFDHLLKQNYDLHERDPFNKLQILIKLFQELQNINKIKIQILKKEPPKIQVKMVVLEQNKFYFGINPDTKKIDINMPQILLCRNTTNQYQIKTFLLRAIGDKKRPYFMIGTHYLSAKLQNNFCEFIKQCNEHQMLKSKIKYMNLYIIDNSTNQKIYNFIATNKMFKLNKIEQNNLNQGFRKQYFFTQAGNFKIVTSSAAGLGKTFFIQKEIEQKNLIPKYFPVAGNLQLSRLYQRIAELKIDDKSALIIQIHNIKEKKILDEFLFQVIFYKCLKYQNFLFLPKNLHIYVQLENVLNQKYFQYYQTLAIFRYNQKFVKQIRSISLEQFQVDYRNQKHMFIFLYLDWLNQKIINRNQITFEKFRENFTDDPNLIIKGNRIRELLKQYLINHLKQKNNKTSYVQIKYFLSLLFQSLKTFASSFYYSLDQIGYYHNQFSSGNFLQYRWQYVNILVKNARQFLLRTVTEKNFQNQEKQSDEFHKVLRQFPFLILPNGDQTSFSFIYKNDKQVDEIIKKYILIQQGKLDRSNISSSNTIYSIFNKTSLSYLQQSQSNHLTKQLKKILKQISNLPPNIQIKQDLKYQVTLDNFFKMCLIVQRMRAKIPIIIMGQTGVGKTALIRYLVQNVFQDQLMLINIHAGINQQHLILKIKQIKQKLQILSILEKKLWVFFDEFNTTQQVGYIKQIIMQNRFLGQELPQNLIFLAACNPFRKKQKKNAIKVGLEKNIDRNIDDMLYKVLPPPQSLIQCMWNFQQLKTLESRQYIYSMLSSIKYRSQEISQVIHQTHQDFKTQIQKSAVNLRDVARFKILFEWFMQNMPKKPVKNNSQHRDSKSFNYTIQREQRAFILSICFCYYMRLQTSKKRSDYLNKVQQMMKYEKGHMDKILYNQQIDYLNRMSKPKGIALNLALRQNVFTSFVCLMNKLPVIIVGMPGCSKSLSVRLLLSNLRGIDSDQDFFRNLPQIQMFQFQGSQSCSSEGVQQVFRRAERLLDDFKQKKAKIVSCILFDEIGLAQLSVHNPLKVLHSHLQVHQTKVSFIGISNWQLDASKMARFLVVNRTIPDQNDLFDTAKKIFQSQDPRLIDTLKNQIVALSKAYHKFIQEWKKKLNNDYGQFFGLRDFYNMIKYIVFHLKDDQNQGKQLQIIKRSIQRNFDGREDSIQMFLDILSQFLQNKVLMQKQQKDDILSLIHENLNDKDARCLLQIIKGQALIYILNQKQLKLSQKNIVTIHGSTFEQDKSSEAYNLVVISDIINYVAQGYVIILKDVPNNIQTSLYDLLNKSYQRVGNKNYARIAVGANYNPKCIVHEEFNCILYIMENRLKQVDPPFLNRFEKHYLTIDKLITHYQCKIIKQLKQWIYKILQNILKKENPLQKQHYLINVCDQSLASLALKKTLQLGSDQEKEDQLQLIIENSKKQLLMNSTTDFKLLLKTQKNIIQDRQFIDQCLYQKSIFIKQRINKEKFMIIYTYDKNTEIYQENIIYQKQLTKVIKICEMKSELQLRKQIQDFYVKKYTNCHIKFNYQNEYTHLCLIIFLFETIAKRFGNPQKRIYLILIISRLTLLNQGKAHKQISYLNKYRQIFIENLEKDAISIDQIPENFRFQKDYNSIFNIKEIISKIYSDCLKRFDLVYTKITQQKNLLNFKKLLQNLPENKIFLQHCGCFIQKNLQISQNWKLKILTDKEIALVSTTTFGAMMQYFFIKVEDLLVNFVQLILQNEIVYCFDYKKSIQILEKYVPNCQTYLNQLMDECSQSYNTVLNSLMKRISLRDVKKLKRVFRGAGTIKINLSYPKLFPFISRQKNYIFSEKYTYLQFQQNKIDIQLSLQKICQQIYELQQKFELNRQKKEQINLEIEYKIKEAQNHISQKTLLIEKYKYDYITQIDKTYNWKYLKEIFLYDITNLLLEKNIETDIESSVELSKLIKYFKNKELSLSQELILLLKGTKLWKKILKLIEIFKQVNSNSNQIILFKNLDKKTIIENRSQYFFTNQVKFVEILINNCQKYLLLNENNTKICKGIKNFKNIFNNTYIILQQLSNQFQEFNIKMPDSLRLMKNFIKTLENISQDQQKIFDQFFKYNQKNIYITINKFLESLKNKKQYDLLPILKHQAGYLYRYWVQYIRNQNNQIQADEMEDFINNFISLVNQEKQFAQNCHFVLWEFFDQIQFEKPISEVLSDLRYQNIEDDNFLMLINNKLIEDRYNNNLSVVLIDFIMKRIPEPKFEYQIQDQDQFNQKCLKAMYKAVKNWFTQEKLMNGIQNITFLAYMKILLNYYIECLLKQFKEQIMQQIDIYLSTETKLCLNLRFYSLKLLRSKLKDIKQIKKKYLNIKRVNWIFKMKHQFIQKQSKEFIIPPPSDSSHQIKQLIDKFVLSEYKQLKYLTQMFKFKSFQDRYQIFNFFMTDIYSRLCDFEQKQKIYQFLLKGDPNLQSFQLDLLKRYALSKITEQIYYLEQQSQQVLGDQIWILNNINFLISIKNQQSPLTSIFFTRQGKLPISFSQHTEEQFILCGKENPFRASMENAIISSQNKNVGVYICSQSCDFVYTIQDCGWPSTASKCKFCEKDIGGTGHKLIRQKQGARRLGPQIRPDSNFYLSNLKVEEYWKWMPIYIQKQIQRIIEKPEVKILEKKLEENKIINSITNYVLTGFGKFTNEIESRLHPFTHNILNLILHSLLYFYIQFQWIKSQDCRRAFSKSKQDMKFYLNYKIKFEVEKLKQNLDISEWKTWLMGIQKLIFETAAQYKNKLNQFLKQKQQTNIIQKKNLIQSKNTLQNNEHKKMLDDILNDDQIFTISKISNYTAKICKNRDFFEKLVEKILKLHCSGEQKINFIKISKNQKGFPSYPFDKVLTQDILQIQKYSYSRILRLTKDPSYQNMVKEYSIKISSEYPILDLVINHKQKFENVSHYFNIIQFVNLITKHAANKVDRQIAKKTPIQQFIKNLKIQKEIQQQLLTLLNKCLASWNILAKKIKIIQYQCKVLGKMNDQYSKQTPLIAFLIDSLDKNNFYGKILIGVLHLFGIEQNQLINLIQAKKSTISHLKDLKLFSQNQYLPQKITQKDILTICQQQLQNKIQSLSSNSVDYGNGIPIYNFQVIQNKLVIQFYGKKRIVTNIQKFINVQFAGEMFSRMGQYSNYITQVRQVGGNLPLPDLNSIIQKFKQIKKLDENSYFITIKSIQGYLQKLMIYFKTFQPKDINLKQYIEQYEFKNYPQELINSPFGNLPIQCIVSLYEEVQLSIINKTWEILPQIYHEELTKDEEIQCKKFFNHLMLKKSQQLPTFQEFKIAFYRFMSRCLVLGEIPADKILLEFLTHRADFWPYKFSQIIRQNLENKLKVKIQIKKSLGLRNLIEKFQNIDEPKKQIKIIGEVFEIKDKPNQSKKTKRNKIANKMHD